MTGRAPIIVDGTSIAEHWLRDIAVRVRALGVPVHIACVLGEGDESLSRFVELKRKAAHACGIQFSVYPVASEHEALDSVRWLASDTGAHGIFVELPLPSDWDEAAILAVIPLAKDVDVITPAGEQDYYENAGTIRPPAVGALDRVMQVHDVARTGIAAVIGRGRLVGRPVAHWLESQGMEVRTVDIDTSEPEDVVRTADIVVTGAGSPGLITADWLKQGAAVFDYGYGKKDMKHVGDADRESVIKRVSLLTPVPGGMGPLVIAATFENLLELAMSPGS